jgi:hypothetical protein
MTEDTSGRRPVDEFILREIGTVPHLEALLLIWRFRPRPWSLEEMAKALYLDRKATNGILDDLARRSLIVSMSGDRRTWEYKADADRDRLLALVDEAYSHELIRISRMIHTKAPAAVREFARAFKFRKEGD